jgi:hypothetical protein
MTSNSFAAKILAGALALGALAGCRQTEGQSAEPAAAEAARTSHHSFAFGAGEVNAQALVKRRVTPNGAETLESSTRVWLGGPHPLLLREKAHLDPSGRLRDATADLFTGPRASELVRAVRIDAKSGTVTVRDHGGERSFTAPVDHPWMVRALFDDVAPAASSTTPVLAWIARRAAQAGTKIREIDIAGGSQLTLPGQVVFQDAPLDLVVVGDEVAEADHDFIVSLPWKPLAAAEHALHPTGARCDHGQC